MEILRALRRLIAGSDRRQPPAGARLPAFLKLYGAPLGLLALVGLGLINGTYLVDTRDLKVGGAVALSVFTVLPIGLAVAGLRLTAWRLAFPLLFIGVFRATPDEPWPWSTVQIIAYLTVFALLAMRESSGVIAWATSLTIVPVFTFAPPANAWGVVVMITAIGLTGDLLSRRRRVRAQLAEQTLLTEQEKDRRAVLEERTRIAREMHDVVAHHMSMIAVQAETAPYRVPGVPASAEAEFRDIAASARAALTDMRRLLGVLRAESDQVPRAPQPALTDIPTLVENAARAGMPVTLHQSALPAPRGSTSSANRPPGKSASSADRLRDKSGFPVPPGSASSTNPPSDLPALPGSTSSADSPGESGLPTSLGLASSADRSADESGLPMSLGSASSADQSAGGLWSEVPAATGLAAYRTVQEALANAARHAPGGAVTVSVRETATALLVEVRNGPGSGLPALPASTGGDAAQVTNESRAVRGPGPAHPAEVAGPHRPAHGSGAGGGHGLTGMRERAAALGGTLDAGPQADGGYLVVARLPLREAGQLPPENVAVAVPGEQP